MRKKDLKIRTLHKEGIIRNINKNFFAFYKLEITNDSIIL